MMTISNKALKESKKSKEEKAEVVAFWSLENPEIADIPGIGTVTKSKFTGVHFLDVIRKHKGKMSDIPSFVTSLGVKNWRFLSFAIFFGWLSRRAIEIEGGEDGEEDGEKEEEEDEEEEEEDEA